MASDGKEKEKGAGAGAAAAPVDARIEWMGECLKNAFPAIKVDRFAKAFPGDADGV